MSNSESSESRRRRAVVYQQDELAGSLEETEEGWSFQYTADYQGIPISLTLPIQPEPYLFRKFPPVFEGLLPEGVMREALLRRLKIDKDDLFAQIIAVGGDLVGSITVFSAKDSNS